MRLDVSGRVSMVFLKGCRGHREYRKEKKDRRINHMPIQGKASHGGWPTYSYLPSYRPPRRTYVLLSNSSGNGDGNATAAAAFAVSGEVEYKKIKQG